MLGLTVDGKEDFREKSEHNRGNAEGSQVLNSKLSDLFGNTGNPTIQPRCWGFLDVKAFQEKGRKTEDAFLIDAFKMSNGQTIQTMGLFSVLLLNYAFEMNCKRFDVCKHGLVGTLG